MLPQFSSVVILNLSGLFLSLLLLPAAQATSYPPTVYKTSDINITETSNKDWSWMNLFVEVLSNDTWFDPEPNKTVITCAGPISRPNPDADKDVVVFGLKCANFPQLLVEYVRAKGTEQDHADGGKSLPLRSVINLGSTVHNWATYSLMDTFSKQTFLPGIKAMVTTIEGTGPNNNVTEVTTDQRGANSPDPLQQSWQIPHSNIAPYDGSLGNIFDSFVPGGFQAWLNVQKWWVEMN